MISYSKKTAHHFASFRQFRLRRQYALNCCNPLPPFFACTAILNSVIC